MAKTFKISDTKGEIEEKDSKQNIDSVEESVTKEGKKKEEEGKKKDARKKEGKIKKGKGDKAKKGDKKRKKKEERKKKEKTPGEKKNIFKRIKWKNFIFPTVALLTLGGIALFYYFGIFRLQPRSLYDVLSFDKMFITSNPDGEIFSARLPLLSRPEEPRTEVSPLNGLLFSKSEMDEMMQRRPVAVMFNNHVQARPLSGLNSADIVIEANVESGITRHLGIFWSKAPEKVGPIRSLRQAYLEWANEYDPLMIYDGCAQTDDPRTNACGNIHSYGLKRIATVGAWRTDEGGRVAPHNEFSSVTNAWDYAEQMDWDKFPSSIQSLQFKRDADITERGEKTRVKTIFHTRLANNGAYDVEWVYDRSTNNYYRNIAGRADLDGETNTQIFAKVVIIQEVKVTPSGDDAGRVITTTIDSGDAVILQDGTITNATWEKGSRTDRTKYYDSSGDPIEFNRGRIWISMIPHSDGKFDIIEQ